VNLKKRYIKNLQILGLFQMYIDLLSMCLYYMFFY